MKQIKVILFDFDGVIADSEKLWFSSAISTLKRMNIAYDNSIKQKSTIGIISEHLFQTLITDKQYDLSEIMKTYQQLLKKTFKEHNQMIYPHLKKFIRSTNLKIGIVSNAHENYIINILKKNNLFSYFKGNITSCTGDIPYKPYKDGYVIGSKKLNLKPHEVLVIEDSDVGIEAALKAKVKKVLRHTNNDKNLPVKIKHRVTKLLNYKNFENSLFNLRLYG